MSNLSLDIATRCDLTTRRGDDFALSISVKDGSNANFNFAGYSAAFTINDEVTSSIIQSATTANSKIVLTSGNIAITIPAMILGEGSFKWDLQLTSGGGLKRTWAYGKILENADTTP